MKDVVVFNGFNSLDFHDIRSNVIRIPEVSARLTEAQEIWDQLGDKDFSFYNFLAAEDEVFLNNIKLKSLAAAVVQVGLFDRYFKSFRKPDFMVGCHNGDAPMQVCLEQMSFEDLILGSLAARKNLMAVPINNTEQPVLSGISLSEFAVFKFNSETGKYNKIESEKFDLKNIVADLIDEQGAKKFVNIGPGNVLMGEMQKDMALRDVHILESIEVDPMLSWFWPAMRKTDTISVTQ